MNINDYTTEFSEKDTIDLIPLIFKRQHELAIKYAPIEVKNGFYYPENLFCNIDNGKDQNLLKNFAWRIVEEIGEALEALDDFHDEVHYKEEMMDGLHFIVELCLLSSIDAEVFCDFKPYDKYLDAQLLDDETLDIELRDFIKILGKTMNCLKIKPWKCTHVSTDIVKYQSFLSKAFIKYLNILFLKMKPIEILNMYYQKSRVNQFRQESNY
jgi:dimeric dUTPase (all-alpha-NTP-PPase superfamily)